ncbi:MAG: tetratricopeptide repeat protein [Phycisphaerae bacterium]
MDIARRATFVAMAAAGTFGLCGCASQEAWVSVRYVLEPSKGLPPGMKAVSVENAKVNMVTDQRWSELAANTIQDLIQDANRRFGADLKVVDRKHLQQGMAEEDLAAAGLTDGASPGHGGKIMAAQGIIQSEINVKVETHRGKQTTISDIWGLGGGGVGAGEIRTREVDTISRNITVQTTFKLVDTVSNRNWITHSPPPFSKHDRTSTFILFGSAQTEASLTPRDEIIRQAVDTESREFVSLFLPCEMRFDVYVESSANEDCRNGVRMLRADAYEEAIHYFKRVLMDHPDDDRAAYGAAVAAEASGRYDDALKYYRRAYSIRPRPHYRIAKVRLAGHIGRIRRSDAT